MLQWPQNKKGASIHASGDSCSIAVEIENGRRMYYRMGLRAAKLDRIEEPDIGDSLVTAFRDDWRGSTPRQVSDKAAASLIARETDVLDPLAIINQGKRGCVYATRKSRLAEAAYDQAPMVAILDRMLGQTARTPLIAGIVLGDLDLVVLYLYNGGAVLGEREMQITINPHSAPAAAASFAAMHHLPPDVETRLFSHEELARDLLIHAAVVYPRFATFLGMPYQQAIGALALTAWVVASGAALWSGWEYAKLQNFRQEAASLDGQTSAAASQTGAAMKLRMHALASLTSINTTRAFSIAEALLPEGGKVTAKLSSAGDEFDAVIPLRSPRERQGSALEVASLERVSAALAASPPAGCSQTMAGITGGMNEIKKTVLCPRALGGAVHGW